jgi:hypothetical protein
LRCKTGREVPRVDSAASPGNPVPGAARPAAIFARPRSGYACVVLRPASLAIAIALAAVGCRKEPDDPARTVVAFLEDLRHADEDLDRARRVVAALPAASRRDLEERAGRASVTLGRRVEAPELIVDAFVVLRFEPVRTRSEVKGDRAVVELFGANEAVEHARVTCAREGERWFVEVPFSSDALAREPPERAGALRQ